MSWLDTLIHVSSTPAFRVCLALAGVALVVFLLCRLYLRLRTAHLGNIEYERTFSESGVYEGEDVELIETIRNRGLLPLLFVDVESYLPPSLRVRDRVTGKDDSMPVLISRFHLMPYTQIRRRHRLRCTARGYYELNTASIYDRGASVPMASHAVLYVYPKVIPMELYRLAVGRMQGEYTALRPLYSDPFSLSGIRDYRFGDSMSHINFKASARVPVSGSSASPLKVNQRDFCASRRLMIYMDFHLPVGSMIDGEDYEKRAERGLSFCSALMRDAVFSGYAVGFAANCKMHDGAMSIRFSPDSSEAHLVDMMRALAALLPRDGASFASLLEHDITGGMRDTEIVVLCYAQGEDTITRLSELARLGNSIKVALLDVVDEEDAADDE